MEAHCNPVRMCQCHTCLRFCVIIMLCYCKSLLENNSAVTVVDLCLVCLLIVMVNESLPYFWRNVLLWSAFFFFKPVLSENVNAVNRNKYHLMLENRHVLFYVVYRCHLCVMRLFVSHFRAMYFAEAAGEQELVAWCVLEVIWGQTPPPPPPPCGADCNDCFLIIIHLS